MWTFLGFSLDPARAELTGPDGPVHVERYPLEVLIYLARNAERVVTRDELIDQIWEGRFVSDTAVSTAIKQARRAVGDSGAAQSVIKTIHGRGFRFVAELEATKPPAASATVAIPTESEVQDIAPAPGAGSGQPSLAILRFLSLDGSDAGLRLASAVPAEIISSLSRVGWLHMIARGSSFRFDPATADVTSVGARLGVRYVGSGTVEVIGDMVTFSLEIAASQDGAVIWSDRYASTLQDLQLRRQEIVSSICTALEIAIPRHEAHASRRLDQNEFDAWSHYHLGLAHIFRFSRGDNLIAAEHFNAAIERDRHFSRAHAGLSFTHWQNAFMGFEDQRETALEQAVGAASRALDIDPDEPFAAFNMGRARWLQGDIDGGKHWFARSLHVNPNSAQSHYNIGVLNMLSGENSDAFIATERAMSLSPLDPLLYAMKTVQAMSAIHQEDYPKAVALVERAMQEPNAHFHIALVAATARELNGDHEIAQKWYDRAKQLEPNASAEVFLKSFPFEREEHRLRFAKALSRF